MVSFKNRLEIMYPKSSSPKCMIIV